MKRLLVLAVLLTACVPPAALSRPEPAQALLLIDWRQTLAFRHAGGIESNPLLGPRPSDTRIAVAFVAASGLLWAMQSTPKPVRRWYTALLTTAEVLAIGINLAHHHHVVIGVRP